MDVSRGVVATGMRVELFHERRLVASGLTAKNGLLEESPLKERFETGQYEAIFHVGAWYREQGVALPAVPFLDVVSYRFGISDPAQHHHLPFKCTPWGYSCFRGGA